MTYEYMIIIMVLGAGLVGGLAAFLFLRSKSKGLQQKLQPIANSFGGKIESSMGYCSLEFDYQGHRRGVSIGMAVKGSPSSLTFSKKEPFKLSIMIHSNDWVRHKWGKSFKGKSEITTGDSFVDNECFVRTDNPSLAGEFLKNTKNRDIVKYFFDNGFHEISANKHSIDATKYMYSDEDLRVDAVRGYLEKLGQFE